MPHSDNACYEFGPYCLNLAQRRLTRAGEIVPLTPKATEILRVLVMNAGRLVERDDLLREVWPNTFVEEANLTQNIFTLRRALGDERGLPKYIETVTRRGYRFVADVKVFEAEEEGIHSSDGQAQPASREEEEVLSRRVIAVLPFVNATGDAEMEYLAEGVTDNVINNLAKISKLRVMARSAVFRRRKAEFDPQLLGSDLGANVVLVGEISARRAGVAIRVELVDVGTGWQVWGQSFDSQSKDLLQIQDAILRQLLVNLKLKLTGEEERRVTARYTENAKAYQAYLEGRYHWSRYTRAGIEKAIGHFRQAIELDPNYALAYAGVVDCYLRLATNYLPPEGDVPTSRSITTASSEMDSYQRLGERIKLRYEWDWKGVERERRRANELKSDYPSPHQWYFAYRLSKQLYTGTVSRGTANNRAVDNWNQDSRVTLRIPSVQLTPTEEVQILCSVAREQIAIGNYQAAEFLLKRWSVPGKWPRLDSLNAYAAADLLFTVGDLFGWIAGSKQSFHGHKHAEAFLNGSVSLFEQLGIKSRSVEARVELARCYYRQGLLDIARDTLSTALSELPDDQLELKTFGLVIWGVIERDSGRLHESLMKLREAATLEAEGQLVTNRCYLDLATTLKELALSQGQGRYLDEAKLYFLRALYESEALGHHRNVGSVENNIGFLLLNLGSYKDAEGHLLRARRVFRALSDTVRGAQVDDTLARLYVETNQLGAAQDVINSAVSTLELTDSEAILAEALTTKGIVYCKLTNYIEAKRSFDSAHKVAQRCGDHHGAARALLAMLDGMVDHLDIKEAREIVHHLNDLLSTTPGLSFGSRITQLIAELSPENED